MAFGKLVRQRTVWVPTWRGWVAIGVVLISTGTLVLLCLHPFLAANAPLRGEILVVEGWLSKPGLRRAVGVFTQGGYEKIVTTGIPIPRGTYLSDFYPDILTFAELSAMAFREIGVDSLRVVAVPGPNVKGNRTFASALALRRWLEAQEPRVDAVDVLSRGPHSRRSWLMFSRALEGCVEVGVIAQEVTSYDPDRWWTSSAGVRTMISEVIAYAYAKLFVFSETAS